LRRRIVLALATGELTLEKIFLNSKERVTFVFTESQETGKAVLCEFRSGAPVPAIRYDTARRELMVAIHKIKREPNLEIRFDGGKPTNRGAFDVPQAFEVPQEGRDAS
jgi:hypothetical protein